MLYQDELSRPEFDHRVFFAGEHTENPHGWMDTGTYE